MNNKFLFLGLFWAAAIAIVVIVKLINKSSKIKPSEEQEGLKNKHTEAFSDLENEIDDLTETKAEVGQSVVDRHNTLNAQIEKAINNEACIDRITEPIKTKYSADFDEMNNKLEQL